MYSLHVFAIPRNLLTSPAVLGACTLTIFKILSGSGLVPSAVNFSPKNVMSFCKNSHFSPFTFKFKAARRFRHFSNASSCSFRVFPWIKISSTMFFTRRMLLRFCCKTS